MNLIYPRSCCILCWLVILIRFCSISLGSGLLRQQRQQKQKNLVHELGVSFGFGCSPDSIDAIESWRFRQHLEQKQSEIRPQHGAQDLKQFIRLQHESDASFGDIDSFVIFFCRKRTQNKIRKCLKFCSVL